jgi:hypothetical protein
LWNILLFRGSSRQRVLMFGSGKLGVSPNRKKRIPKDRKAPTTSTTHEVTSRGGIYSPVPMAAFAYRRGKSTLAPPVARIARVSKPRERPTRGPSQLRVHFLQSVRHHDMPMFVITNREVDHVTGSRLSVAGAARPAPDSGFGAITCAPALFSKEILCVRIVHLIS